MEAQAVYPPTGRQDAFWDLYSKVYDAVYHLMPYRKLLWETYQALDLQPGMRVLDAGCGTGNLEHFMAEKSAPAVTIDAIDFSPGMLAIATEKCSHLDGVEFRIGDLDKPLPFPDATFDRIVSINVLYALPHADRTMRELTRVLKPGGKLVVTSPTPEFRVLPLVVDHFKRVRNIWGTRRRLANIAHTVRVLSTSGIRQWILNNLVINRREAEGQYHSLDRGNLRDLLARRAQDGLGDFEISSALADQNLFATASKAIAVAGVCV
jgi:ubiquinone/menaquinone biosynthesis C-methylase UbiE